MKREQIINKIYDKIRDDLLHSKLLYWEEDDTNKYPLVDHLSSGDDISTGRDEIDNLIEQIEVEPLIDAILAIPLDVPTDEEIAEKIQAFRKNKLSGYGNMSIGRLQLGELEWSNLVLDICKWMREEIIKRN
jgi:hypothetical protein